MHGSYYPGRYYYHCNTPAIHHVPIIAADEAGCIPTQLLWAFAEVFPAWQALHFLFSVQTITSTVHTSMRNELRKVAHAATSIRVRV